MITRDTCKAQISHWSSEIISDTSRFIFLFFIHILRISVLDVWWPSIIWDDLRYVSISFSVFQSFILIFDVSHGTEFSIFIFFSVWSAYVIFSLRWRVWYRGQIYLTASNSVFHADAMVLQNHWNSTEYSARFLFSRLIKFTEHIFLN